MKAENEKFKECNQNDICLYIDSEAQEPELALKKICRELKIDLLATSQTSWNPYRSGQKFIAAILSQGKKLEDDLEAILNIKEFDKELPIIFHSKKYSRTVEYLIRRQGIHFFLLPEFPEEELYLVLHTLKIKGKRSLESHALKVK